MGEQITSLHDLFKQLADGFSIQNKTATRFWLALAFVAALISIPNPENNIVTLPFLSKDVSPNDFYSFSCVLLSLLTIGFGSAHCQAIRTRKLIQRYIDNLENKYIEPGNIHIQDIFDSIVSPAVNRVAPLAQILQGKYQFYPESNKRSVKIRVVPFLLFVFLRFVTILVMYIFPIFAIIKAIIKGNLLSTSIMPWGIPIFFFWLISFFAVVILFELYCFDIAYSIRSIGRIILPEKKAN